MTISLRFFLEKLAIYLIFHCKNVMNTGSKNVGRHCSTQLIYDFSFLGTDYNFGLITCKMIVVYLQYSKNQQENPTMTTVNLNLRLDKELKDEVAVIFENYGMTTAGALKMFLVNVAKTKTVPLTFTYQADFSDDEIATIKHRLHDMDNIRTTTLDELFA